MKINKCHPRAPKSQNEKNKNGIEIRLGGTSP
jgi:hypothetical protein